MTLPKHLSTPALGLIVLRVDETIEPEFRRFVPGDQARLYVTRLESGDDLTPQSIARMERRLSDAAALLPAAADFDVVAYACTSGTAFLGDETVAGCVKNGIPTRAVTNPLSAAIAQMADLGVAKVGIVSPYLSEVADTLTQAFEDRGIEVPASIALKESNEAKVVRIPPARIRDAAHQVLAQAPCDALFLSCTNLNTADFLEPLSAELGVPVLSSNHALAWHMKTLAGIAP